MFNPQTIKKDFPILGRTVHGDVPLVYLDSAATSQKPKQVIQAISKYYEQHNANVHRGIHTLGDESTQLFHASRKKVAAFFGCEESQLIITRNTTEALNAIVPMWAEEHCEPGSQIITTEMEHHSDFVPWQQFAKRKGCDFVVVPVKVDGTLDLNHLKTLLKKKTSIVFLCHVSNALGTINPVQEISKMARDAGAMVVVDGAQGAPHLPINLQRLGCDVYAFSGHKMLGPMGIGGMVVKKERLTEFRPYLFGGGMINEVAIEETSFAELPDRFIAGTPDVAGIVGLAEACSYLTGLGMSEVEKHDRTLVAYALEKLSTVPNVTIVGPTDPAVRCGSVTFIYKGVHAHDVAQILDSEGVAVRSGHHCTMPLHTKFGWGATTRASFNVYTTKDDIDVLVKALGKVKEVFGGNNAKS